MLTDRRRVEFALPAVMAFNVVSAIAFYEDENQAEIDKAYRLKELVLKACHDPLEDLTPQHGQKLKRRIDRVAAQALRAVEQPPAGKLGMILFYALEHLIETKTLELIEGSTFADAMELLLPALDRAFAEPALDASAKKQARRLIAHCQKEGLYT